MPHILNVNQIFIEKIFLDWDYYHFKPLRRAGSLVLELECGFFDKRYHGVCTRVYMAWRVYIFPQMNACRSWIIAVGKNSFHQIGRASCRERV